MNMHRPGELGGGPRSARQLIRKVQFCGRDKRSADPGSGDHLNQAGVRRDSLRWDMVVVCHRLASRRIYEILTIVGRR
jgi:hypothetical protein